jgi:hypothetical protein
MVVLKPLAFGAGLFLAASLSAQAAGPSSAAARDQMQFAQANLEPNFTESHPPGPKESSDNWIAAPPATAISQSYDRYPGPKIGPSGWIPASVPTPPAAAGDDRDPHPYSQHGTGPMPN